MKNYAAALLFFALCLGADFVSCQVFGQDHIREMDTVRSSMTSLGNRMPEIVKKSKPEDIRTFERVYEINNYALVTIESYLKMLKVAVSSKGGLNKDVVVVLNGWLGFIKHYCEYDIQYFDEVLSETKDETVVKLVEDEKRNVRMLQDITDKGMKENTELLARL